MLNVIKIPPLPRCENSFLHPQLREVLDCASPLALFSWRTESGRGLPHSKTLARRPCRHSPTRSILSAPISFGFVRINSRSALAAGKLFIKLWVALAHLNCLVAKTPKLQPMRSYYTFLSVAHQNLSML
jgi:hypothetical protein